MTHNAKYAPEKVFLKRASCTLDCEQIHSYNIGLARISLLLCNNTRLYYCIDEPEITENDERIVENIVRQTIVKGEEEVLPSDPSKLRRLAVRIGVPYYRLVEKLPILRYYTEKVLSGYGPLYPLMRDPEVEEIAIDKPYKPVAVVHRRFETIWIDTNIVLDGYELDTLILYLARRIGKPVSVAHPYAEGLTPEGHRIALTFSKEISRFGSSLVVRKHFETPLSAIQLIEHNILSSLIIAYLWMMVDYNRSILIVGPTASGKTTLLQALLGLVPSSKRIVTIEDTPELNLFDRPHWDSLVTRHSYSKDVEDVTLDKLARFALRRRPDVLVIGEVRGKEAEVFLQAAATGHAALATMHAHDARSALDRLRAMGVPEYLLDSLDIIVVVSRVRKRQQLLRRVIEVVEQTPHGLRTVFSWMPREDSFRPITIDEIVKRSFKLESIVASGLLDAEEALLELKRRTALLERLRSEGVYEFRDVYKRIDELYAFTPLGESLGSTKTTG